MFNQEQQVVKKEVRYQGVMKESEIVGIKGRKRREWVGIGLSGGNQVNSDYSFLMC